MRVTGDGTETLADVRVRLAWRVDRDERERAEIVRQRELILGLEEYVKAMLRLRRQVQSAFTELTDGNQPEARRMLAQVLERWPSR